MKARLQQERIKLSQTLDTCRKCTKQPESTNVNRMQWCSEYCDVPEKLKAQLEHIESLQKEDRSRRNVIVLEVDKDLPPSQTAARKTNPAYNPAYKRALATIPCKYAAKEEIIEKAEPTLELFLNLRIKGKTRSEIARKHFRVGPRKMDELLDKFGIRRLRDERKAMEEYKQKHSNEKKREEVMA